jgi:hypothetical protein
MSNEFAMIKKLSKTMLLYIAFLTVLVNGFSLPASAEENDLEPELGNVLIERGVNLKALDPKHEKFGSKLHQLFDQFDGRSDWDIASDHIWMPPLDVVSGKGLAVYKNAGRYILEVDARRNHEDGPFGDWIMLFNQDGHLISEILFGDMAEMETHILGISDIDHDERLEWLMWGVQVLQTEGNRQSLRWESVESTFLEKLSQNFHFQLYVMNRAGVLEYKRGKPWATHYKFAADLYCPFLNKPKYSFNASNSPSASEMRDQRMTPSLCLTALEGTEDEEYIWQSLVNLQDVAKANWEINYIANSLDEEGYPFIKRVLIKHNVTWESNPTQIEKSEIGSLVEL